MLSIRAVAAALVNARGEVLIAERPPGKLMAGWWEFPGGKIEEGESEEQALRRELYEELGVEVLRARSFMNLSHDYPDRHVQLALWIVERFNGEPRPLIGQRLKWVSAAQLPNERMLEADRPFIEALCTMAPQER